MRFDRQTINVKSTLDSHFAEGPWHTQNLTPVKHGLPPLTPSPPLPSRRLPQIVGRNVTPNFCARISELYNGAGVSFDAIASPLNSHQA
jgi:hypothetical protein